MDTTPGLGHNNPSAAEALRDRADQLADACNAWLSQVPEIETDEQEKKAVDFMERVKAEIKEAEAARKAEKEPHVAAGRAVDAAFNPIKDNLETIKRLFSPKLTAWMNKKEAKRKEAERLAQDEAYRKIEAAEAARVAAEQAQASETASDVVGATIEAEAARVAAEQAVKDADKVAKSTTTAKGNYSTRAVSYRSQWSAKINDYAAALEHFQDHPKVRDMVQSLANARAQSAEKKPVPGVEFVETKVAV